MNRRKFFSASVLATGGLMSFPRISRGAEGRRGAGSSWGPGDRPGRIIHMVADGMSMGTLTAADYVSHQLRQKGLTWIELTRRAGVRTGIMNMRSLNSMVTDSSAASSSWGSGSRVANGALNQLPSGKSLTPLYRLFGEQGWKRGLVTTTEITHATPAGFAAVADSRDNGLAIAAQYLEGKVDVLLGGGEKFFEASKRKDKRNLKAEYAQAGYRVMRGAAELRDASLDQPWLGIFSDSHVPYMLDWKRNAELQAKVPPLTTMTRRALEWLGRHEHFILQVEGGRVDHAAHNCDAPAAMQEMVEFDEALELVLGFQKDHPDTLIVVTTDHGNGNLGVNGSGSGAEISKMFRRMADVKASFGEIMKRLRQRPTSASALVASSDKPGATTTLKTTEYVPEVREIQSVIEELTGYKVSERRATAFRTFLAKDGLALYEVMNSEMAQLGQLLGNYIAVGWTGGVHTADYVPVTALGPGADRFGGFIQNVDVFRHYTQLAGIDFRNPEEAMVASVGREAHHVENAAEYALV